MKNLLKKTVFILSMLFTTITASAYDFEVDGIYYSIESLSDLTVKVVQGDVKYEGDIVIPVSVKYNNRTLSVIAIGEEAFRECGNLTSVTIPNSVTSIGYSTFRECGNLTSVTIPNSVTSIGDYAFYYCYGLTSVTIPNSVTSIGEYAFYNCYGLTSVTIPNSVTSIGGYAFSNCDGLTSVTIPNSVTSIGNSAFSSCHQLKIITLHEGLEEIGGYCFAYSGIEELIIPNSVTTIGEKALSGIDDLKMLQIGTGLNNMGNPHTDYYEKWNWFNNDLEKYKNFEILKISDSDVVFDFKDWSKCWDGYYNKYYYDNLSLFPLKEIYIGRPLTWDQESYCPFSNIKTLNKIEFGGFCEKNYKLTRSTALKTLILGENIKNVYTGSYILANNLTEIYIKALVPPTVDEDFENKIYLNTTLYIPKGTLEAYQAADIWKNFWNIVEYDYTNMSKVETVTRDNVSVMVEGSSIVVNSPVPDATIDLYDLSGRLLYRGQDSSIDNLTGGIYIVKLLGKTFKVAVK